MRVPRRRVANSVRGGSADSVRLGLLPPASERRDPGVGPRLPITLVFMALLALVISQWVGPVWGRHSLLLPLVLFGIASVAWWRITGDLRPYAVAQFGPALVMLPAFWFDRTIRGLWPAGALYALAKVAETFDRGIYAAIPVSGHTLKHLAAALATFWILQWRRSVPPLARKLN